MHISNKKKSSPISLKELDEWCDRWYDFDYDYDCDVNCPCCAIPYSEHETFFLVIAELVADLIITQQNLNADAKKMLVEERMYAYTSWARDEKMNDNVKGDIAFIWPHIKDTQVGRDLFAKIFGQRDE